MLTKIVQIVLKSTNLQYRGNQQGENFHKGEVGAISRGTIFPQGEAPSPSTRHSLRAFSSKLLYMFVMFLVNSEIYKTFTRLSQLKS